MESNLPGNIEFRINGLYWGLQTCIPADVCEGVRLQESLIIVMDGTAPCSPTVLTYSYRANYL